MKLRSYQIELISEIKKAWANGAQNVGVQLSTGGGKTVLFCYLIAENKGPSIAIAHRVELVSQISLTLAKAGIKHNLIAQKSSIRQIVSIHIAELGKSFYTPMSKVVVAGVDTLLRMDPNTPWFKNITLVVQDEGHHPLKKNKWGKVAQLFSYTSGLYPTATPVRADGNGLGRHADGIIDTLVLGPHMRDLIKCGYLTDYRIISPPSDLDLSHVAIAANGEFNLDQLRKATHKSHIVGDVVAHYLKFARGKQGVTFTVDISSATEIAAQFRASGVSAECISSKTPDLLRAQIMRRFRSGEILQLVNVDILGEGFDVPGIEVVSFARATNSYAVYAQQFGRALRPKAGKTHAIIIDHVNNYLRHGVPDGQITWSLDRREKRSRTSQTAVNLKTCLNPGCYAVYERIKRECPICGHYTPPQDRSSPQFVDGDLTELDSELLAKLRGEIVKKDSAPNLYGHDSIVTRSILKNHNKQQDAQKQLRDSIAKWAGAKKHLKHFSDSEIYKTFYFLFGIDILSAQVLNTAATFDLINKIDSDYNRDIK